MNKTIHLTILLFVVALSGCADRHQDATTPAPHQISNAQAGENALKNGLAGGPLESNSQPLSDFNLHGYKH